MATLGEGGGQKRSITRHKCLARKWGWEAGGRLWGGLTGVQRRPCNQLRRPYGKHACIMRGMVTRHGRWNE